MGKTSIEWTETTWNPLRGCSRVSEGCRNCYAETVANRFSGSGQPYHGLIAKGGQWNGAIKLVPEKLQEPLRWARPRMVFVNSMSDLFHEAVPTEYIDKVFAVMALASRHTFQVLTKRPDRMSSYMNAAERLPRWRYAAANLSSKTPDDAADYVENQVDLGLPNVWLGVSVEDQATADERIPLLMEVPAAVRWISAEPLLGKISLVWDDRSDGMITERIQCLDWVVVGGESGAGARPMHPAWVRSLQDQCERFDIPFFFKQWGEWVSVSEVDGYGPHHKFPDGATVRRVGKKKAGRTLDGREWSQYPAVKQQSEVA